MKNLLLGLSVLSYGSGVADLLLCAWLVFRSKKAELASVAGSFSVFTLAILGPNLEFFQILFGGTSARLGWLVGGLATWISWILVLGVLAYAVFRGWRVPSEAQGGVSTRVFRMLAVVNLAFIVLFALGFFWNPRPALLSLFFLENLAYLAANVGSLFLVSRKVIGSEVGKASGPPPPRFLCATWTPLASATGKRKSSNGSIRVWPEKRSLIS